MDFPVDKAYIINYDAFDTISAMGISSPLCMIITGIAATSYTSLVSISDIKSLINSKNTFYCTGDNT